MIRQKRSKLINELLERPERAEFWSTYFADLFRLGFNESRDKGAKLFLQLAAPGFSGRPPL